ncbi:SWI/SNF-related matrix-associated actin-dependent regulator of chromatin subfamily A-like protein 1 [Cylas formicarius]|uniref:SWI/SNF-related matrix-associated actin-dependent regulator of chromatin subfamily A-like protein 1 n=1 Tax=Cylas formicarius TaxID=197179 RepID=UPI002958AEEB|nr:SWI/SNF-related matrix-associated actin-dependent regulator of chromatin subfamily A-like protein 1 [Cylas formicarius]
MKMSCSPAEIERKKQEAIQRLAQKRNSPVKVQQSPFKFSFKSSPQPANKAVPHSVKPYTKVSDAKNNTIAFYGKDKLLTITINLISPERFNVTFSTFSTLIIDIFKTIPSRYYDPNTRVWNFHVNDYDLLLSKLRQLQSHETITIKALPQFVVKCIKSLIKDCDIDKNKIDPVLYRTLLPFQMEGLKFGIERSGRCMIADDMGLGKTFQALAIMNYYQQDWPLLIVTTASMKNVWEDTIFKYLPSVSIMHIQYMSSSKDYIGESKILILSHDLMQRCCDKLLDRGFGCIIIDESHNLKSFKAKSSQAATKLAKKAKRVVLLSGTPALSRPCELYQQLVLIDDKFFGMFNDYALRYCDRKKTPWGWDDLGKSNLQELEIILLKKFMIRRTKEDVLKMLPNKTQEVVKLDLHLEKFSEQDKRCLEALATKYKKEKGHEKHAALLTFFAETAKMKIPSVCSYILQILERAQKFLVFAHHHVMLNAIEDLIKRKNVNYIRIDGNTTSDQRKFFVDKFQQDPTYVCAILSIMAANAGITLTAAQLVVFAELHWNPTILSQAEARAHRIGQENTVLVQYLLADGTADDSIWPLLKEKEESLSEFGLCKKSLDNASVRKQDTCKADVITDGLNISVIEPITVANTLNISSYFTSPKKKTSSASDLDEALNDGLDDVLGEIDF